MSPKLITTPPIERVINRIDRPDVHACWLWQGARSSAGYGMVRAGSKRDGTATTLLVHRVIYEAAYGVTIPPGMTVDHRCFNRLCQNPFHMELIPMPENTRRGALRRWRRYRRDREG